MNPESVGSGAGGHGAAHGGLAAALAGLGGMYNGYTWMCACATFNMSIAFVYPDMLTLAPCVQ